MIFGIRLNHAIYIIINFTSFKQITYVVFFFKEIKILPDYRVLPKLSHSYTPCVFRGEIYFLLFEKNIMSIKHVNKIQQELFCNFDYYKVIFLLNKNIKKY